MNLFGNALKYTDEGFIQVCLQATPLPTKNKGGRSSVKLTVTDSGRGMSHDYLCEKLFTPFAQENSLTPGTGLGLSIVKQIVESMGGQINVESEKNKGTCITVTLRMLHAPKSLEALEQSIIATTSAKTDGLKIGFVGFEADSFEVHPDTSYRSSVNSRHHFMTSFHKMCKEWFGMDMHVVAEGLDKENADIYLTTTQGADDMNDSVYQTGCKSQDQVTQKRVAATPLLVLCDAASTAQRKIKNQNEYPGFGIAEYISQPCGPRKLAKALCLCLERLSASANPNRPWPTPTKALEHKDDRLNFHEIIEKRKDESVNTLDQEDDQKSAQHQSTARGDGPDSSGTLTSAGAGRPTFSSRQPSGMVPAKVPRTVLLVDDNHINLQLLVTYMKRSGHTFVTACDGLEALEAFKSTTTVEDNVLVPNGGNEDTNPDTSPHFDYILMDISMPVMDGLESTRRIRAHEREHNFEPPATIIALSGVASSSIQQDAYSSGIDMFLTKPVRLRELTKLFESKEKECAENSLGSGQAGSEREPPQGESTNHKAASK